MIMLELFLHQDDPDGISTKAALMTSGVPPTTALRFIDRLEEDGLINTVRCEVDRRRRLLSLTPNGHAAVTRTLLALENLYDPLERANR